MIASSTKILFFIGVMILCASQSYSETFPIKVEVKFEVSAITNAWDVRETNQVIRDSRAAITQELQTAYHYWDFRADGNKGVATITFRIVDPDPHDMIIQADLQLDLSRNNIPKESWSQPWLLPTDIQYSRYPTYSMMAQQLALKFRECFINDQTHRLSKWLFDKVPIGEAGAWMNVPNDYLIVLSMPEEKYADLRESIFKIIEKPLHKATEILEASGQGDFAPYPSTNGSISFNGIMVKVDKRSSISGQPKKLVPALRNVKGLGPVFLKEEMPIGLYDVAIPKEDE